LQQLDDGSLVFGPPKTDAGRRTLALPKSIAADLEEHLATWTGPGSDALVFTGEKGGPLRKSVWSGYWRTTVASTSLPAGFRFHDLRHTANTIAVMSDVAVDASFDVARDHDAIRVLDSSLLAGVG
jgi:integrase